MGIQLKLVACSNCHTQFDVTTVIVESFPCRCGETIRNEPQEAIEAAIRRCGSCGAAVPDREADQCEYCSATIIRDTRELSLICPECFARNAESTRFCCACGVGFHPEAVVADGVELPCPVCTSLMPPRSLGGIPLNECPSCNGLWVTGENFELIVNTAIEARKNNTQLQLGTEKPRVSGANPAQQRIIYRKCPVCDKGMHRNNYKKKSGVIIDQCHQHGTWLDADELEQIAGFILSGGLSHLPTETESERIEKARARMEAEQLMRPHFDKLDARKQENMTGDFFSGTIFNLLEMFFK